jgi:HEAT repeat protein
LYDKSVDDLQIILLGLTVFLVAIGSSLSFLETRKLRETKRVDYGVAILFGFLFAVSIMLVIALVLVRTTIATLPTLTTYLFVGTCCFLVVYPFFELLYLGKTEKSAVMEYQYILQKLVRYKAHWKPPRTQILAVGIFLVIYALPPLIIAQAFSLPIVITGLSWFLVPPIVILSYYGSKGTTPPLVNLSLVGKSSPSILVRGFITIVSLGVVCYSLVSRTLTFIYGGVPDSADIISTLTLPIMVGYALYGFFSRYWLAELKIRSLDIIFSGYLLIAIAVNTMVDSLAFASESLESVIGWTLTSIFIEYHSLMIPITILGKVSLLLFVLKDLASSQERTKIKMNLIKIGVRKQDGKTISILLQDENWKIRYEAASGLVKVARNNPRNVPIKPLLDALEDIQWEVCAEAAIALGEIGARIPNTVPREPLQAALNHELLNVTIVVEEALRKIESGLEAVSKPIEKALKIAKADLIEKPEDVDSYVRDVAYEALREICEPIYQWPPRKDSAYFSYGIDKVWTKLGDLPLADIIQPMIDAVKDASKAAVKGLQKIVQVAPELVPVEPVIEGLRNEPIHEFKGAYLAVPELLADLGLAAPKKNIAPLIERLKDDDFKIRCGVAIALGKIAKNLPEKRSTIISALEIVFRKYKDIRIGDVLAELAQITN